MHQHYEDILDRIAEPPAWFDEGGVPRYGAFSPERLGNIYANEAVLAGIACQQCGRRFAVALDGRYARKGHALSDEIRFGTLHYGDPPNVQCCGAGPSMNSVMHDVLEYWVRDLELHVGWRRDKAYEGPVAETCEPVDAAAETLAAVADGRRRIRVECTSQPDRYAVAGRVTAAMAARGRVLVTCPRQLGIVAARMLDGLVPPEDVGHLRQPARITVVSFEKLPQVPPATMKAIVVLAGVPPWKTYPPKLQEELEESWRQTSAWLASASAGRVLIELGLAGRRRVIDRPDAIVHGWRLKSPPA